MELVKIGKVKGNESNPRYIKEDRFKKLVKSIKEFPEMLKLRPIVVNEDMIVLGGNMRLKACVEAGIKEVYILKAEGLSEEQQKEFVIKDNLSFGEWDWDVLGNEWDNTSIVSWGLDVWNGDSDIDYEPTLNPDTLYSDVTKEEIEKKAKELASAMLKEMNNVDIMCPECNHEFKVQI